MIKVVALVRRRPDIPRDEFIRLWTQEHVRLSQQLGMSPYRINIATESQDNDDGPPYDGTAEMYWPSLLEFRTALASVDGVLAGVDVTRFAASVELMVVDEWVIVGDVNGPSCDD